MAYDYSPEWLLKRKDTVAKLIQIAQSGEVLHVESERWVDIKARQAELNNCLASIARNMPELYDIREKLRTWTEYKHEVYHLYVGQPQHKLTGRPGEKRFNWIEAFTPNYLGEEHRHTEKVTDAITYQRFVGVVKELPKKVKIVRAEFASVTPESVDHFQDVFEPLGWTATVEETTLILMRS